ncbi:hypothetical protein HOLleu_40670 [Holothuria leucospilota]|uniref:Uncharacterized protein n=1 Tax=Holothuria leucospilota TaxID=206669 RepID=A0A9Q0YGF5_HOLLE|nr:hypothetical protein HOLleu_40670 [Holothuria leucospilota]
MDVLLGYLPDSVSSISIWADGPASQFKNRYMAASLDPLGKAHKIDIKWNFFPTSHSKGPVDGTGGSAKSFVMQKVLSGQHIVTNTASFTDAASTMENVCVTEVSTTEITRRNGRLNLEDIFSQAKPITAIAKMHFLEVTSNGVVYHVLTKDSTNRNDVETHSRAGAIVVGDWFLVEYEGK